MLNPQPISPNLALGTTSSSLWSFPRAWKLGGRGAVALILARRQYQALIHPMHQPCPTHMAHGAKSLSTLRLRLQKTLAGQAKPE